MIRFVFVVKVFVEEDVGDDVEGFVVKDKGGVEGLVWKTSELLEFFIRDLVFLSVFIKFVRRYIEN